LLRAQLARITHATELCPKGVIEIDEETQEEKVPEEEPSFNTETLKSLETWGHRYQNILNAGRCSHMAPLGMTDEEKDEYMAKVAEEDKVEERFRMI